MQTKLSQCFSSAILAGVCLLAGGCGTDVDDTMPSNDSGLSGSGIPGPQGEPGPAGASPFELVGDDAVYSQGNVGIGTDAPTERLDVDGNAMVSGTVTAGAFNGLGPLQLQTAGTPRIHIDDETGRIGIGTTSPGAPLHMALNGLAGITLQSTDDTMSSIRFERGTSGAIGQIWYLNDTRFNIKSIAIGGTLNLLGRNDQGIIINENGSVGVGATPTAARMTVGGNVTILGTMTALAKNFAHPHPTDPDKQINYVCLEGPEHGTYVRGTARLVDGRAQIEVPEHFRMVTRDQGLTVHVTPMGRAEVWVDEKSLQRIVVRGSDDVPFDYLVHGVRQGFDEYEPIGPNTHFRE